MIKTSRRRYREFRGKHGVVDDTAAEDATSRRPAHESRWRYLREYWGWLRPHRTTLATVFGLALFTSLLGLVPPYVTKYVVDDILMNEGLDRSQQRSLLMQVGGALLALLLFQQGVEAFRSFTLSVLNAKVIFRLRQRLFEHMLHMPLKVLSDLKGGGIVARVSGDVDEVQGMLQMGIITPGVALIRVALTVVVLMLISWKLSLVALALIPPVVLLNVVYLRRIRPIYRAMRKDRSDIDGRVVETFGGIRVVRAFGRERRESRDYAVAHHTVIRKTILAHLQQLVVTAGWGLIIPLTSLVIIWYGGLRYLAGEIGIGGIIAFQMYVLMLLMPVTQIVFSYGATQRSLAAMERTFDMLAQAKDKPDRPDAVPAPRPLRELVFEDVSFEYVPDTPVLRHINLRVSAGQTVALVGPSGAGKSTLTDLVARFIDPVEGRIRLNGVDLRDLRLASFRQLLGVVQQSVFLFDGTVRDNIAYGRRGAAEEQIIAAARSANADEFIGDLPDGYDTVVGERGVKLSGGQQQRISIARAMLADSEILILDEATSNLDTESEQLIQASLAELFAHRTTFVIAHRLSTITQADLIVVLVDGEIAETGTHAELMAAGGKYEEMIHRQMRTAADEVQTLEWS